MKAIPDHPEKAYAEALAEGRPEAPVLNQLISFKKALYRRDLEEARALLPKETPFTGELSKFLDDLKEERLEPWLSSGPAFLRAEAWVRKGAHLAEAGEKEAAREAFERALALDPRHPRAIVNLGNLELEAGRVEAAILRYQEALKIDEELADAHHNLAAAYKKKGDIDRMVRHLKRAQRLLLYPPRESRGRRGGVAPIYTRFWFWFLLAAAVYFFLRGAG